MSGNGTWLLGRVAFADQYPKGADIRQAARDSVIRCAIHFGFDFRWRHDMYGSKWVRTPFGMRCTLIPSCRSTAVVTGPMPEALRLSGAGVWVTEPSTPSLPDDLTPGGEEMARPEPSRDGDLGVLGRASNVP